MDLGRSARRSHTGIFFAPRPHNAQGRVLLLLIGALGIILLGALAAWRASGEPSEASRDKRGPSARVARVYQEKLDGQCYVNRDLGLSVEGPKEWKLALGARAEETEPYEGLVLKMEPSGAPDAITLARPLISVVKRSLAAGASPDPAAYIRQHCL